MDRDGSTIAANPNPLSHSNGSTTRLLNVQLHVVPLPSPPPLTNAPPTNQNPDSHLPTDELGMPESILFTPASSNLISQERVVGSDDSRPSNTPISFNLTMRIGNGDSSVRVSNSESDNLCLLDISSPQTLRVSSIVKELAERIARGEVPTHWFHKLLLLDHVDHVQQKMLKCLDEVDQQIEGTCTCMCNCKSTCTFTSYLYIYSTCTLFVNLIMV